MRTTLIFLALFLPFTLGAKDTPKTILSQLPRTIEECARDAEIADFSDPRLGQAASYRTPGMVITVYAFDLGQPQIAEGVTDRVVMQSFTKAKQDIQTVLDRGMYSSAKLQNDGTKTHDGGVETLVARYDVVRAQGPDAGVKMFSEIHVFGAREHVIKIRVSGESAKEAELGKVLATFIPKLIQAITHP
jgi:hypothetical protein